MATLLAAATPAPSPAPQSAGAVVENDPVSTVRTATLQTTYTPSTYGPGNFKITQFIARFAALRIGKSLVRVTLPRLQSVSGVANGLGDMQMFYLFARRETSGTRFAGIFLQAPSASNPILGTGRWIAGPAAAQIFVFHPHKVLAGVLVQSGFAFAGPKSRGNQSAITVLPFATVQSTNGWFVKLAEAPWLFDLQRGATLIPLGLGVGRAIGGEQDTVLLSMSDEVAVVHANFVNAPKNTLRLSFTVIFRSKP